MKTNMRIRQFEKETAGPHGWIQWKGTKVCIDIYCACGQHSHFDGDFMYYGQCSGCGQYYECDGTITLHPIPAEEIEAGLKEICEPVLWESHDK